MTDSRQHHQALQAWLLEQSELEDRLEALRRYKKQCSEVIEAQFDRSGDLLGTLRELSELADAVLVAAYQMAYEELRAHYGLPACKDHDGNYISSSFAIIGMGKLGGRELHFGSDLDLIFVYSRNGETLGRKSISNQEYFAKLSQRLMSYLSLPSRSGFAYKIDTELRPSGKAGALVTSLDSWVAYYHEHAALWEKQALLKARLVYADEGFEKDFTGLFKRLVFLSPFPPNFHEEIHRLRVRIQQELTRESERCWYYKKGRGSLLDIEFIVQYLQLRLGRYFEALWVSHTFEALQSLEMTGLRTAAFTSPLREAYLFYRRLEIALETRFGLKDGYLDLDHECVPKLAPMLGCRDAGELIRRFGEFRRRVRETYRETFQLKEDF